MVKNKKDELIKRLKPLIQNNIYYYDSFEEQIEIINGDRHSISYKKIINSWLKEDASFLEKKVLKLEASKIKVDAEAAKNKPLEDRKSQYQMIDHLLFEAIAEKENGKPEKMKAYLILRAKIKKEIPK